jgi:hypothetical protein
LTRSSRQIDRWLIDYFDVIDAQPRDLLGLHVFQCSLGQTSSAYLKGRPRQPQIDFESASVVYVSPIALFWPSFD